MPFTIRPYRRCPVYCPVTCQTGLFEGEGTVLESLPHWLAILWQSAVADRGSVFADGEPANAPADLRAAGIVRWVRGEEEYGVETLVIDDESWEDLEEYLSRWEQEYAESIL